MFFFFKHVNILNNAIYVITKVQFKTINNILFYYGSKNEKFYFKESHLKICYKIFLILDYLIFKSC